MCIICCVIFDINTKQPKMKTKDIITEDIILDILFRENDDTIIIQLIDKEDYIVNKDAFHNWIDEQNDLSDFFENVYIDNGDLHENIRNCNWSNVGDVYYTREHLLEFLKVYQNDCQIAGTK